MRTSDQGRRGDGGAVQWREQSDGDRALDVSINIDVMRRVFADRRGEPELMKVALPKQTERAAELFHALSDATRIEILLALREGEQCVCDLTAMLESAQSRLSFHLKVLKDAGLIADRREGRWMYYRIAADGLSELDDLVASFKEARRTGGGTRCC